MSENKTLDSRIAGCNYIYKIKEYESLSKRKHLFEECTTKWKWFDGSEIEVKDMFTLHRANCIKMIEKRSKEKEVNPEEYQIYNILKEEYSTRISKE